MSKMYANLSLDQIMLKDAPSKKLIQEYKVRIGRACKVVQPARFMLYYRHQKGDTEVINQLEALAKDHPTRGFDNNFGRIRNEG